MLTIETTAENSYTGLEFSKSSCRFTKLVLFLFGGSIQRMKYKLDASTAVELWSRKILISPILLFLKNCSLLKFNSLMDFSFQDYIGKKNRFLSFYILQSYIFNVRALLFSQIKEAESMFSVTLVFTSAGWMEREAWDMFGVYFYGNKFMVRLLTDYGFVGFPLRKDFPLTGFRETFYDDYEKRVLYVSVELMQEYRVFNLRINKWEI